MWTARDLAEWRDFYLLVGTAGATLVALLFVAVSIGVGFLTRERAAAVRIYMSPVVVCTSPPCCSSRQWRWRRRTRRLFCRQRSAPPR
jgi:hypothetical protein